jgi:AraC family transcriptional regulator
VVRFVPGRILTEARGWSPGESPVLYREFAYDPQGVDVPGIDSVLLVVYREGHTRTRRTVGGPWRERRVRAGNISVLGVGQASAWEWERNIRVSHLYLPRATMANAAALAFDCGYERFTPTDRLCIDDPVLRGLVDALTGEMSAEQSSGRLLCDLVSRAIGVHVLRQYHQTDRAQDLILCGNDHGLSPTQKRRVTDFVAAHLCTDFSLGEMAGAAGLSESAFLRRFKESMSCTPWQFVMKARAERTVQLISETRLPLAEIAYRTGFSDQSHMTRIVKKHFGTTPGKLREARP